MPSWNIKLIDCFYIERNNLCVKKDKKWLIILMCVFGKTVSCLICLLIFGNCTHLPKNSGIKSKQDKISTKQFPSKITRIPPNTCRVKATVVELDSLELIPHSTKVCEIAPCTGIIRIDSIIGYGSDFGSSLVLKNLFFIKTIPILSIQLRQINMNCFSLHR